ncbi:MAG: hypothetical protein P4L81_00055 [Candidatus Pacebacteria bacterium]|jgi:hypothetical protein|nr:hypothetical protein [Candidatus Paceibacterota bacterium]
MVGRGGFTPIEVISETAIVEHPAALAVVMIPGIEDESLKVIAM